MKIDILVNRLRQFRSFHRVIGAAVALLVLVTASTGVLLGWKKNSDTLQPPTVDGTSQDLTRWKSFSEITRAATQAMDSVNNGDFSVDRLDVRPDKGIIKVIFKEGYWEVQVDGATGRVLSVARRHSDWLEHLHDGSIVNDLFKLVYTNILGFGLLILSVTGVYLWYVPGLIRRFKERRK